VRATNVNNESTTKMFVALYTTPVPTAPRIASVSVDLALHKIIAHIESDLPLDAAPAFVRIYGEVFTTGLGYGDGYCEMRRVSNWFEDPTGWVCTLNAGWTTFPQIQGITVVAYAGPGLFTSWLVTPADQYFHTTGSGTMTVMQELIEIMGFTWWTLFDTLDLDTGYLSYYLSPQTTFTPPPAADFKLNDTPDYGAYDVWLRIINYAPYVHFGVNSLYLGKQGDPGVDFRSMTRGDIQGMSLLPALNTQPINLNEDNVFVFRTNDGRYGKLRIRCWSWWKGIHTYRGVKFSYPGLVVTVDYEFVTFNDAP